MENTKIPKTQFGVAPWITARWSARSFTDKKIEPETLFRLFEAASWSASSMNEQPWRYIYAYRGTKSFDMMHEVLMAGNQPWAKDASVLIISLAKINFDRNDKPNRHHMHDAGAANTTLLLQAAQDGILGHMMGGFDMEQTIEKFNIDTTKWEIACLIALGYPGNPESLDEPYKTREQSERTRNAISTFTEHLID
jgi:nitroreductase